ncbi:DNA-(apurinic or apyrimidinic site) lyase [Exophiala dermatitidis]|nr:DNA-(apurinic or apyrimidinic site) lyase [Exophiala dermatitidis]KAJ4551295.1 DNA-(apurinic or apyrimidinic site) lyase [Exophiala dermatitidis]
MRAVSIQGRGAAATLAYLVQGRANLATAAAALSDSITTGRKRKRAYVESSDSKTLCQRIPRGGDRTIDKTEDPSSTTSSPRASRNQRSKKVDVNIGEEKDILTSVSNGVVTVQKETKVEVNETETVGTPRNKRLSGRTARSKGTKVTEDEAEASSQREAEEEVEKPTKPKRKRKTKEEKEEEARPLASRATGLKMFVGAHTSIAKGVENAITNCVHIGGNAFACFLKSQRKWENPPLKDENRDAFVKGLIEHQYDGGKHIVPHGSYLVNLATEDPSKAQQSYETFIDDLHRCEALGIRYYNFHPGGAGGGSFDEAIIRLANNLNRALSETTTVVPLLENMAGHGTLIGGRFSDLRDVIAQIKPEFRSRIGVCIDTCHAFAAGYDLRSPESFRAVMDEFDSVVGIQYLKAMHLNDSKAPLGSHRDLHQNIGLGFLGLRAFHNIMNDPRFQGLPLILETPCERPDPADPTGKKSIDDKSIWATEIKLLESLIGMDPESDQFKSLDSELSARGKDERDKMQAQFDAKREKERIKLEKKKLVPEKGQTTLAFGKAATAVKGGGGQKNKENNHKTKKKDHGGESEDDDHDDDDESELSDLSSELSEDDDHV